MTNLKREFTVIFSLIRFRFQISTAYVTNNWGNLISTVIYSITAILFIKFLFYKATIPGYSLDETLFVLLIFQIVYFLTYYIVVSYFDLINLVRTGYFDYYLVRPFNVFSYLKFSNFDIFSILRDGLPAIGIFIYVINWQNINISFKGYLFLGYTVLLSSIIITSVSFIAASIVFFKGESTNALNLILRTFLSAELKRIPWKYYEKFWYISIIASQIITTSFGVGVAFGQVQQFPMVINLTILAVFVIFLTKLVQIKALKSYTSASS